MNSDIKKRWVEALTSGEYIQGKGALRDPDNKYCCLGVLCDLHNRETNGKWCWEKDTVSPFYKYLGKMAMLPNIVRTWSGVMVENHRKLSDMNDSGVSFKGIAEYIDKNL